MKPVFILIAMTGLLASCANLKTPSGEPYDVLVEGELLKVKDAVQAGAVDAVERDYEGRGPLSAVAVFRIRRVLAGELPKEKIGGPSRAEQAVDAAKSGNALKVLTLDFQDPEELVEKTWLRVAVSRPSEIFGVTDWENPPAGAYRIYLEKIPDRPDSYYLIANKKGDVYVTR